MHHLFPTIPIDKFNEEIFEATLKIYNKVAKTEHSPVQNNRENVVLIVDLLKNMSHVEFVLGSSLHNRSKLFLWPIYKQNGLCVGFDIEPNTSNDFEPHPQFMMIEFRDKMSEYIETLGIE